MLKWTVSKRTDTSEPASLLDSKRPAPRRSLGNLHRPIRHRDARDNRRKSLGSTEIMRRIYQNKENQILSTPHPIANRTSSSTPYPKFDFALRDLSNLTPTQTPTLNPVTPNRKRNLPLSPIEQSTQSKAQYASTLPTFDIEYSPCGMKTGPMIALRGLTMKDSYFENPCYFRDELPASKRLKFSPEVTPLSRRLSELRFSKMSYKRGDLMGNDGNDDDDTELSSKALDDTELEKMIDAILESSRKAKVRSKRKLSQRRRRLSISPTYTPADDPAADLNKFYDKFELSPEKLLEAGEKTIIIQEPNVVNEREVRTPDSIEGMNKTSRKSINETSCHLKRQRGVRRKHTKNEKCANAKPKVCSKITDKETSPHTPPNFRLKNQSFAKKIDYLAAMETPKDLGFQSHKLQSNVSKTSYDSTSGIETNDLQGSSTPTGSSNTVGRCLIFPESPDSMEDSIDKRKSIASSTTSRCSKSSVCAISGTLDLSIFVENERIQIHVIRCKDLYRQNGGAINAYVKVALLPTESGTENGFQRTTVHRNSSRPFFDHRFVFERSPNDLSKRIQLAVWHRDREFKRSEFLGCMSFSLRSILKELTGSYKLQPQSCLTAPIPPVLACELPTTQLSPNELTIMDACTPGTSTQSDSFSIPLSKRGIFQRDADEHLFLRFLELDKQTGDGHGASETGRTQFTITKKLIKTEHQGYGFSIVWTHPPRIEKVENGLPADLGGIQPGDFVVFVDKHNVVTMPEIDILNLIRSLGNSMSLEIYRRPIESGSVKVRIPSMAVCGSEPMVGAITPRPLSMPCSTVSYSIENVKQIPQIAFSKDIGHGVIV